MKDAPDESAAFPQQLTLCAQVRAPKRYSASGASQTISANAQISGTEQRDIPDAVITPPDGGLALAGNTGRWKTMFHMA